MEEGPELSSLFNNKGLQCKNLQDYLKTLPSNILDKLFSHPTTCLAVFRDLPDIAKHYIIRLLFVEQPVPQAVICSWVSQDFQSEHHNAVKVLSDLKIWQEASIPGGLAGWILNPNFRKNCKISIFGGGRAWMIKANVEADSKARDVEYLDKYAMERWECVLHYMVGSQQQEGISADAVRVLIHAGLMKRDEEDGSPVITREGFQFLLLDTPSQVWYFMLQYLDLVQGRGLDLAQCLHFLFQLSFSVLGKDYSTEGLSEGLLVLLQHLREFGLVYQRKRKGGKFYPTRLAVGLGATRAPSRVPGAGFLITESNYRVYAYTESALQVALLGLFAELRVRLPRLCVATITRESVRAALRCGVSASQITGFLRLRAHPRVTALPPTVADQLRLWERERERLRPTPGVLYSQFLSAADFAVLRDFAAARGLLVWQSERRRHMVVTRQGHDQVKKFWKKHSRAVNGVL